MRRTRAAGRRARARRGAVRAVSAAAIAIALLGGASDAAAYCRSTTCDPAVSDCPTDDNGCPRGGAPLTWRELPLVYRFHRAGSEKLDMGRARAAVRRAFGAWESVSCNGRRTSLSFVEGPDIRSGKPLSRRARGVEPFGIYFRDDAWPYTRGDEALALTNMTFGTVNGFIDYADIEINTTERAFAVEDDEEGIDLEAVVIHEVGHYIGLSHSNVKDSIMVARYCQSGDRCGTDVETARALSDDDAAAVCALYPPSGIAGVRYVPEEASCSAAGAGMGADVTDAAGARARGALALLTVLATIAAAARRSRGRVASRRIVVGVASASSASSAHGDLPSPETTRRGSDGASTRRSRG